MAEDPRSTDRRLRDEPLRPARHLAGLAIPPEVVAGLAGRKIDRVAGRIGALGVRAAEAREHQHARHVDVTERGNAADDIVHQLGDVIRVVDHHLAERALGGDHLKRTRFTVELGYYSAHHWCQDIVRMSP